MHVKICIGSSCHLRGSQEVIKQLTALCKAHDVKADIELSGSFCMGVCQEGVSVKLEDGEIFHLKPEDTESFFEQELMGRLKRNESN